jgi:UDP-N-acetyl-D-galactosamine dehydrogenase
VLFRSGRYFGRELVKKMIEKDDVLIREARVLMLGITFKENVPDIRNSRVLDIINELHDFGITIDVTDPIAHPDEVKHEYGFDLVAKPKAGAYDAVVFAVKHAEFVKMGSAGISKYLKKNGILYDIKETLS